jgi:hypothetical protein
MARKSRSGAPPLILTGDPSAALARHRDAALVLTSGEPSNLDVVVIRHARAAAQNQAGACPCCRVPSDLVAVLRRLLIERASGEVDFAAVIIAGDPAELPALAEEVRTDPVIAARYALDLPCQGSTA